MISASPGRELMGTFLSYIPWSLFGPQLGRVKAAVLPWHLRGSHGSGSTSVLPHHGPLSCPCVLSHRAGLCRHVCPWAGGAAGPGTGSPLFLQLLGTEGAVGGSITGLSWEMLQKQPERRTQLPSWAEVPLCLGVVLSTAV